MEIIKTIEIRKFRSIKSLTTDFNPTHLNIFVGKNDQGKSNVLRALNLFFNNETDLGQPFRFDEDYCYYANTGTGTRREIRIDLIISPPKERFQNARLLRWTRKWKRDGSIIDERNFVNDGSKIFPQHNIYKWLDKLKYRYVPAIKGANYFLSLMGGLHDVLNESHSRELALQGQSFISGIQNITHHITNELNDRIGIPNTIQVPSDFKQLFSNLDFGSKIGENTFHLKQRGDGIKIRHIPIILKYMSDEEKNISIPGYVKPDTIWGFEEPENNLELNYAYDLAVSFKEYSRDIQIFLTTHSPAFYSLDVSDNDGVNMYYVEQNIEGCSHLKKIIQSNIEDLHDKMGVLPIITPYLTKIINHQNEIESLKTKIDSLSEKNKCYVLTEDEKNQTLIKYFHINGFNLHETKFVSYNGCDQINAAFILANYLMEQRPGSTVIIHRDSDYLTHEEIMKLKSRCESNKYYLFYTSGVDIESHFIIPEHINALYSKISIEAAERFIEQATDLSRQDSIKRFLNTSCQNQRPPKNDLYGVFQYVETQYQSNIKRFRYGKKVMGHLLSLIQKEIGKNPDLIQKTKFIRNYFLETIAKKLWN
ncbi:MAG: AAA family ATPase [Ignavibacteria bacterium]|nr:AAA family ATPase [Ignavibacteria bacterium]